MWSMIIKGGWVMVPIFICSFFALAIIVERLFFFLGTAAKYKVRNIKAQIIKHVRDNNIPAAKKMCDDNPFYVTAVLKAGLDNFHKPTNLLKEAMEDMSLYEVPKLERNLHFLGTIAHVSPLLGLLGTVTGLVSCFGLIETKASIAGSVNPSELAGGIWEALITTVAGLCVAIPAYIAYNYFVHAVSFSVLEMERAATELLEVKE